MLGVDARRAGRVVAARILATDDAGVTIADNFRSILDGLGAQAAAFISGIAGMLGKGRPECARSRHGNLRLGFKELFGCRFGRVP